MRTANLLMRRGSLALLAVALAHGLAGCTDEDDADKARAAGPVAEAGSIQGGNAEVELVPVAATASGQERGDLSADKAIDKKLDTRWSSAFNDAQHLTLDYGKPVTVTRLQINWQNARAESYQIQVSNDGNTWTTVRTITGSAGGVENLRDLSATGRYLRVQGIKRATQYGYSIIEIQAYANSPSGTTPPNPTTPDPTTPNPTQPTQPDAILTSINTTSSADQNGSLSAKLATDGNLSTRWSSKAQDDAWLQLDFGVSREIGSIKLVWENAYALEYEIQSSDDGVNWRQVRHVYEGRGGTEELLNLRATGRYLRVLGIRRATQYGYSLFEVEVRAPGPNNTLPTYAPLAYANPVGNEPAVPLYGPQEPVETLQFTLPDGTLVTRFGVRGLARHGRERGEDWNEVGYGPNETVDALGNPVDKGPGNFLTFIPQYFKNRTWGFEIIDDSRVAGVIKPKLRVNQYFPQAQLPGGVAWFRAFDRPGVTGYGWMAPGELADKSLKLCPPVAYPPNGKLLSANVLNNGCSLTVDGYPGHGDIGPDGLPNGRHVPGRPLVVGDVIEVSPSFFSTKEVMQALGDNGGIRYYAGEWTYVVGVGLRPSYGIQPRLMNAPLPAETLAGGDGSVSYNYSDNGSFMFQQPHNHIGMQNMQRFVEGRRLLHTDFFTGKHKENGNDDYLPAMGKAGPFFNQSRCVSCHTNNGRSDAPTNLNQRLDNMTVKAAQLGRDGKLYPHALYGASVQMNGKSAAGTSQDWGNGVRVIGYETRLVQLADGTRVELRKPKLGFEGPVPERYSLRSAQPMIGTGLLEAVPEADIVARARTTPDADGIVGVANYVFDPETGQVRLGRFGWKASQASLRGQVASALLHDMSVTSPVYPRKSCHAGAADCRTGAREPGVTEDEVQKLVGYLALLAVPAQRSLPSGFPKNVAPLPEHNVNPVQVQAGRRAFAAANCVACHTPEMKTGNNHPFAELRNQTIRPYTDMLLHDMGEGLADDLSEGRATGRQWRTAPLWGIGYTAKVQEDEKKVGYLHDGRARTLQEAILWHGGEAARSRQRFEALSSQDREALLAFLRSL